MSLYISCENYSIWNMILLQMELWSWDWTILIFHCKFHQMGNDVKIFMYLILKLH
jgi:hypothetical protein